MDYLIALSNKEIAWHGFIKKFDNQTYLWYDIILYPQYNTGITSTSDEDEYTEWLIRQMNFDNFEEMRIHGHSHVNMGCTPSGTDEKFRQDLISNMKKDDFYFFIIANKRGEYDLELYDFKSNICYETKDITVQIGNPAELDKAHTWAQTAIKNNVRSNKCSTTQRAKTSSTLRPVRKKKYTSSVSELWEDPLQNFLQEQD